MPIRLSKVGATCSVRSAAKLRGRRGRTSCLRTTWSWCRRTLTRIPPTDTHGRAAECSGCGFLMRDLGSCETRDTVEFVDPGGNWEGVVCPASGADVRHARVGRGHEPRLSRRLWLCRAACGSG